MIVCILWQHRLAVRHVCSQRGLFFAVEADGVLAITRKGEGWMPVTINTRSINGPKAAGCSARKR